MRKNRYPLTSLSIVNHINVPFPYTKCIIIHYVQFACRMIQYSSYWTKCTCIEDHSVSSSHTESNKSKRKPSTPCCANVFRPQNKDLYEYWNCTQAQVKVGWICWDHRVHTGVDKGGVYLPSQLERTTQLYTLWVDRVKEIGRAPPTSPGWANFSIMMECTPENGKCRSACTLWLGPQSTQSCNRCFLAYIQWWG